MLSVWIGASLDTLWMHRCTSNLNHMEGWLQGWPLGLAAHAPPRGFQEECRPARLDAPAEVENSSVSAKSGRAEQCNCLAVKKGRRGLHHCAALPAVGHAKHFRAGGFLFISFCFSF